MEGGVWSGCECVGLEGWVVEAEQVGESAVPEVNVVDLGKSEVGKGTTFFLRLPLTLPETGGTAQPSNPLSAEPMSR